MKDQDPNSIKESIRHYIRQYDAYSKTIDRIKETCKLPTKELEKIPRNIQEYRDVQNSIIKQIDDEKTARIKLVENKTKNKTKIVKSFERQQKLQIKLMEIESKITVFEQMNNIVPICSDVPGGIAPAIAREYRNLTKKLNQAKKVFPDLMKEVELETGIQYSEPI
ncbi:MAG TPA: hypothetical protein VKM55_00850 [Candidatus Lokiarchaeia archaeon]|nr:hypothetical protein [Candidatus Lokiarchaeia archaeon]